jgi:ABC-type phosphate transport system substrate-binding protein
MQTRRTVSAVAIAIALSLTLTACDPPMPESLRIAQAELEVQCETGDVSLSIPEAITDVGFNWTDSLAIGCTDMTITATDEYSTNSNIVIGESSLIASRCEAFEQVPVALDAAVLVANIPDIFEVFLDPTQIVGIFNGTITSWADPALAVNNEGYAFPDIPIVLSTQATVSAKNALAEWIGRLAGEPLVLDAVADASGVTEAELAMPMEEGAIGIASFSAATYMGSAIVAILTTPGDYESLIYADNGSISSAGTQLVATTGANGLELALDPAIEPTPEQGTFEALAPYQAIYPVSMALCGADSTLIRTAARYLLRQDSQGVIASATMLPLPESARIEAIKLVVVGLPVPTPVATEETDQG